MKTKAKITNPKHARFAPSKNLNQQTQLLKSAATAILLLRWLT
jgi:hypothetical protein